MLHVGCHIGCRDGPLDVGQQFGVATDDSNVAGVSLVTTAQERKVRKSVTEQKGQTFNFSFLLI